MPCFHYKVEGHPDEPVVRNPTISMSCWCPHCHRDIYVPLTGINCPKCEEYYKAEIEHWKERYAKIIASLNDGIKKIETKTFVNPAREMWLEYLIELRNSLED